jgi:hypothetical protein
MLFPRRRWFVWPGCPELTGLFGKILKGMNEATPKLVVTNSTQTP